MAAYYELDANRNVHDALFEKASEFLNDNNQMLRCRQGRFIQRAAELLVPSSYSCDENETQKSLQEEFKINAFCGGAIVAIATFGESDLTQTEIDIVLKHFYLTGIPIDMIQSNAEETKAKFNVESAHGLSAHPELRSHTEFVVGYYAECTQSLDYGIFASIGLGFCIARLDKCVKLTEDASMLKKYGFIAGEIDWDEAFEKHLS